MGETPISPQAPWASQFILDFQPRSCGQLGTTLSQSVDPSHQQGQRRSRGRPCRGISGHRPSGSCGPFIPPSPHHGLAAAPLGQEVR